MNKQSTHLIRFGSNSNWEKIELDDIGVRVAKRSGYDVVKLGSGEPVHAKNDGDIEILMKSLGQAMSEILAGNGWWGCRNCDYEVEVDKVPRPDDSLCLDCRDSIYNKTEGGVS